jgi:DNA mismatch repair protein PMS2
VNPAITRGIKQEFKLCAGPKRPTVVLFVTSPRDTFDFVPDAPFVRATFQDEAVLQSEICRILSQAWKTTAETQIFAKSSAVPTQSPSSPTIRAIASRKVTPNVTVATTTDGIVSRFSEAQEYSQDFGAVPDSMGRINFSEMEVIGQWNRSFIITRLGSSIYAIDQHAACEATNFDKLRKVDKHRKQPLIQPILIKCAPEDLENAITHQDRARELGFDYTVVDTGIEVHSVPSDRTAAAGIDDLQELLGLIQDVPHSAPMTSTVRSRLAYRACHSSVRAGDAMSHPQMRALLERMSQSDFPWNCPHGRPTWCCIHNLGDAPRQGQPQEES